MAYRVLAFRSPFFFIAIATADIAAAQGSATGCLNPGGQLSRVQIGEEPLGGECRGNQQEVQFILEQTATTLTINEEVAVGARVDVGPLGDFEFSVGCTELDATRLLIRLVDQV